LYSQQNLHEDDKKKKPVMLNLDIAYASELKESGPSFDPRNTSLKVPKERSSKSNQRESTLQGQELLAQMTQRHESGDADVGEELVSPAKADDELNFGAVVASQYGHNDNLKLQMQNSLIKTAMLQDKTSNHRSPSNQQMTITFDSRDPSPKAPNFNNALITWKQVNDHQLLANELDSDYKLNELLRQPGQTQGDHKSTSFSFRQERNGNSAKETKVFGNSPQIPGKNKALGKDYMNPDAYQTGSHRKINLNVSGRNE